MQLRSRIGRLVVAVALVVPLAAACGDDGDPLDAELEQDGGIPLDGTDDGVGDDPDDPSDTDPTDPARDDPDHPEDTTEVTERRDLDVRY